MRMRTVHFLLLLCVILVLSSSEIFTSWIQVEQQTVCLRLIPLCCLTCVPTSEHKQRCGELVLVCTKMLVCDLWREMSSVDSAWRGVVSGAGVMSTPLQFRHRCKLVFTILEPSPCWKHLQEFYLLLTLTKSIKYSWKWSFKHGLSKWNLGILHLYGLASDIKYCKYWCQSWRTLVISWSKGADCCVVYIALHPPAILPCKTRPSLLLIVASIVVFVCKHFNSISIFHHVEAPGSWLVKRNAGGGV